MSGLCGCVLFTRVCVDMLDVFVKNEGALVCANPNTAAGCVGDVIWYIWCLGAMHAALGSVSIQACLLGKALGNLRHGSLGPLGWRLGINRVTRSPECRPAESTRSDISLGVIISYNWGMGTIDRGEFIRNWLPETEIQVFFWCFYALKSP